MDKLVVDLASNRRECVSCGFSDERPVQAQTELRTRVNRPRRRQDTPPEAVRLITPPEPDDG
jgi:hypothetical protein